MGRMRDVDDGTGQGAARSGPDALARYDSAVATAAKADDVHRAAKRALIVAQIAEREARELANAATMAVLDLEAELRGERAPLKIVRVCERTPGIR